MDVRSSFAYMSMVFPLPELFPSFSFWCLSFLHIVFDDDPFLLLILALYTMSLISLISFVASFTAMDLNYDLRLRWQYWTQMQVTIAQLSPTNPNRVFHRKYLIIYKLLPDDSYSYLRFAERSVTFPVESHLPSSLVRIRPFKKKKRIQEWGMIRWDKNRSVREETNQRIEKSLYAS